MYYAHLKRPHAHIPYSRDYKCPYLLFEFVIEKGTYICVGYL